MYKVRQKNERFRSKRYRVVGEKRKSGKRKVSIQVASKEVVIEQFQELKIERTRSLRLVGCWKFASCDGPFGSSLLRISADNLLQDVKPLGLRVGAVSEEVDVSTILEPKSERIVHSSDIFLGIVVCISALRGGN